MRNLILSPFASFGPSLSWTKRDLPMALEWRSNRCRVIVPGLWILGAFYWILAVGNDAPRHITIFHVPFLVGVPLILAVSAAWWAGELLRHRFSAKLLINDDQLEWQFGSDSEVDCLSDCSRFRSAGKHDYDARIEWNTETPTKQREAGGWTQWAKRWGMPERLTSDRALYARDVELDRHDLGDLCELLNQLRDEAIADRPA